MSLTVICHFYNEEYLLPFWLEHHRSIFSHGVMIDYNSSDHSRDIIKKICPTWEIRPTRNIKNGRPNFEAILVDEEVMDVERVISGYKIVLNVTEFLFIKNASHNFPLLPDNIFKIQMLDGTCNDDAFVPIHLNQMFDRLGEIRDMKSIRYIHNASHIPYTAGRHGAYLAHDPLTMDWDQMFILKISLYNLNPHNVKRRIQIGQNIPISDRNRGFGFQHMVNTRQEVAWMNFMEKEKWPQLRAQQIESIREMIRLCVHDRERDLYIFYSDLVKHGDWGARQILLLKDTNLLQNTPFAESGYGLIDIQPDLQSSVHNLLWKQISTSRGGNTPLEQYHRLVSEEEHQSFISKMPFKKEDPEWLGICNYLEGRISQTLEREVEIFNDDIWVRVCRPSSLFPIDNNPLHRDICLPFYRNLVNIYFPIAGSNSKSSLKIVPASHLWSDDETMTTKGGAWFQESGKKYSVDAIVASRRKLDLQRPDPNSHQVLLFSPYLIHGGSDNQNENMTRFSLEIRFIEKHSEKRKEQEASFRSFLKERNWR